jgi:hypothetical protein
MTGATLIDIRHSRAVRKTEKEKVIRRDALDDGLPGSAFPLSKVGLMTAPPRRCNAVGGGGEGGKVARGRHEANRTLRMIE